MDWFGPTIAILAALFAGWQAYEARKARTDAKRSAAEAQEHEQRSLSASERIASALERQNSQQERDRLRATLQERVAAMKLAENPWELSEESVTSGKGWRLRLGGDDVLDQIRLTFEPEDADVLAIDDVQQTMKPGESIHLRWYQTYDSPRVVRMHLHWVRPSGEELSMSEALR